MTKTKPKPSLNAALGFPALDGNGQPAHADHNSAARRRIDWWLDAKFGMFAHWGLYSAGGLCCINMTNQGIPLRAYIDEQNKRFTAERFDADELVGLAVEAGCKYMVVTTRHHEGYCLWDTDTTRFSSAHMAPKRDLIGEYVRAARRVGMRIGLYYSLVDWRYQAYWNGPRKDPKGWNAMVDRTHEQVRELMTRYGKIDIMWYDGQWRPREGYLADGWGFKATDQQMAQFWRAKELNAEVRQLQPQIIINNRTYLPEDFGTPETMMMPEDRPWEMCDSVGYLWGSNTCDKDRKSAVRVIHWLTLCAAHGGNLLLNVGPKPDGTIIPWQRKLMRDVGAWMHKHGEAIYGARAELRNPFLAGLSPWHTTRKGDDLYFHLLRYPGASFSLANTHDSYLVSAELMDDGRKLRITHEPTRDIISGLPARSPDPIAPVVKVHIRPKTESELKARRWIAMDDPDRVLDGLAS